MNSVLTYGLIAKRAVQVLENNLVMAGQVYRGYESEYSRNVNGYKPGATITIRRPAEFLVNDGATVTIQDATEGSLAVVVNKQKNVGMAFSSKDMTLDITEFSERFIEPAMIQLAQQVDQDTAALVGDIPNWVGTPGNLLTNFNSFAQATQRMDDTAVNFATPRCALVTPADARSLQANLTGPQSIFAPDLVSKVYREGVLGRIDGTDVYKGQNYYVQTTGTRTSPAAINNGVLATTWEATKDSNTMVLSVDGLGVSTTIKKGEVFTIANVFDVNPRNYLPYISNGATPQLKQFVVMEDVTATAGGAANITISPPIIPVGTPGAHYTTDAAAVDGAAVTFVGTAGTSYPVNVVFNKNAFALVTVPMEKLEGGVKTSRMSHKGVNVRVSAGSDIKNDENIWRFDILYGTKTIDPRQAVRLNGIAP